MRYHAIIAKWLSSCILRRCALNVCSRSPALAVNLCRWLAVSDVGFVLSSTFYAVTCLHERVDWLIDCEVQQAQPFQLCCMCSIDGPGFARRAQVRS